jgi:hypothetical protein
MERADAKTAEETQALESGEDAAAAYQPPSIIYLGSFEELTAGTAGGASDVGGASAQ